MTEVNAAAELHSDHSRCLATAIGFDGSLQAHEITASEEVCKELKPGTPEFAVMCRELDHRSLGYRFLKRFFDVAFSLCAIIVGFIPGLLLSVAIAIDTKGSPIYSQVRVGKWGKPFRIYKFRTMVADSDNVEKYFTPEQLEVWKRERKVDGDPRIDSRIIETNTRRPLSALVFASVFPPKNTVVSTMFPQVNARIMNPAEMVGKFFAQTGRKTTQFFQKLAKRIIVLLKGLNIRIRIPSGAAGFMHPASA